jgi:hypothetical protein
MCNAQLKDYPSFKTRGSPTPNDKLVICDKCGKAYWTFHSGRQSYCHNNCGRMREATPQEYTEGKVALKTVI